MLALVVALACLPQSGAPAQQTPPATPTETTTTTGQEQPQDWSEVDRALEALPARLTVASSPVHWGGFVKLSWAVADDVATAGSKFDINRFAINNARLYVSSSLAGWDVQIGLRGEQDTGNGFFGDVGTVGPERAFEVLVSREVFDELGPLRDGQVHIGRFRAPFLGTGMIEDNQLLFLNRTFNGERWDYFDQGVSGDSRLGPLRGWLAVQNGTLDGVGDDVALTVRGMWDVVGDGVGYVHEGALDAAPGFALSFGGAAYFDTTDNDASSQSLETHMTMAERMYAHAEMVDNGNGLGDLYSWEATFSVLVSKDVEVAARYGDFERADGTKLWRFGVNKYLRGHGVKVQLDYSDADSHAPRADVEVLQVGLVVSL